MKEGSSKSCFLVAKNDLMSTLDIFYTVGVRVQYSRSLENFVKT